MLTAVTSFLPPLTVAALFPGWVLWLGLFDFLVGDAIMIYLSMMGPFKRRTFHHVLWTLLNPVYWPLHSVAAYKALWRLVTRPHYWEKTVHGLSHAAHPLPDASGGPAPTLAG